MKNLKEVYHIGKMITLAVIALVLLGSLSVGAAVTLLFGVYGLIATLILLLSLISLFVFFYKAMGL